MKQIFTILFLFASFCTNAQTTLDTTFVSWKAKALIPGDWNGNVDSSRQGIVFMYGRGEVAPAAYTALDNYGPFWYVLNGWTGDVSLGNGTHYPIIIGLQAEGEWMTSGQPLTRLEAIRARYNIKKGNFHACGFSAGSHAFKIMATEDAYDSIAPYGPFTYASAFKSLVDLQGVLPDDNGTTGPMPWFQRIKNFPRNGVTGGANYLGIWGTADGDRQIPRLADSMNTVVPGSAIVIQTSDGHNNTAVDKVFGGTSAPQQFNIGGTMQNVYQWMLRQGDTTLAAPPPTSSNAGNDTTVYINQTRPDSVYLNGSAATGSVFSWSLVSGTNTPTIVSPGSQSTWVTGLVEGSYTFRLTVDGTSTDDMNVFVRDWMKKGQRPCRVGTKQSFTLTQSGGEIYRPYITRDNVLPSLLGGDTIYIQGGTFTGGVELGDIGGSEGCPIVIAAKDLPVTITNGGFFRFGSRDSNMVSYIKVDGTTLRGAGHPYGFISSHTTYNAEGFTANQVHHLEVTGVFIRKKNVGMMVKKAAAVYPFTWYDKMIIRNVKIHGNYITDIEGEGMYIGHTSPKNDDPGQISAYGYPPRMDTIHIYNNIVDSTGWDGIQLSNATNGLLVYNNFVTRTGQSNVGGQQHSILIGSNIYAPQAYQNVIITGTGGFGVFSSGGANIYSNIVHGVASTTGEEGIYIQRNPVLPEIIDPLTPTVTGNIITGANTHAIFTASTPTTSGGTITGNYFFNNGTNGVANNSGATVNSNTTLSSFALSITSIFTTSSGASITLNLNGTPQTFTSATSAVNWVFAQIGAGPTSNFRDNRIRIRKMRIRVNN